MKGTYDLWLVALSIVVATAASYVALALATHVTAAATRRLARIWLVAGALSMGTGIWSMHFIGMLAFRLPMPMSYSIPLTVLSLAIAVIVSGFALERVSGAALRPIRLLSGGVLMGIGIAAMHYTGMAAMQMRPAIRYAPFLFALSVAIAIAASLAALWIAFRLRGESLATAFWRKTGSAVLMGAAICGMHYTGMAAAIFAPHSVPTVSPQHIDTIWLAAAIAVFTLLLLASTFAISMLDAKHRRDVGASKLTEQTQRASQVQLALANAALRASQDQARAIIDAAMDAYIAMDAHSVILDWNREAERTFGWTRAEVLGKNMAETIVPVRYRQAHLEGVKRFFATGEGPVLNKRIEIHALHRDGHEFPVELAIWQVGTGPTCQFSALLRDISESKLADERLRRSEAMRARAQRVARLGNWELEVATGKFSLSPEVLEIFGLAPADFGGGIEHFYAYVHPDDAAGVRAAAERSVRERVPLDVEYRHVRSDGETRVMHTLGAEVAEAEQRRIFSGTTQDVTERRAEGRRLARSEAMLARAQRIAHLGSWEVPLEHEDPRSNPVLWSDETYRIFGFAPGEVAIDGPTYFARVHPDDLELVRAAMCDVMTSVREYSLDHRIVLRDGRVRHVHGEASIERDDDGRPRRVVGTVQDITARKRDELALEEQRQRFRSLFDYHPDAVFSFDLDSRMTACNEVMLALTGLTREQLIGLPPGQAAVPSERAALLAYFERAVRGEPQRFETHGMRPDGMPQVVHVTYLPIVVDGRIVGVFGIARDITDRKRAEGELQQARKLLEEEQQRFRSLFDYHPDAVFAYDLDGCVTACNEATLTLAGRTREQLIGMPLGKNVVPSERAAVAARFERAVRGEPQRFETTGVRGGGTLVAVHITALPIVVDRRIMGVFAITRDITELARASLERDAALANLERSNRELQDFAFVASHDLQEPLRKVQAFGGRLRDEYAALLGERGADYLERMTGAAVRMQRLIEDLLRYSRVTSRSQPFEPVELGRVAQEVRSDLETSIEAEQAAVELEDLPRIDADPTQMRQLFQNLIGNALKFRTAARPIRVTVSATEVRHDGTEYCRIEFRDNGIGFDPQHAQNIFMPFHRLHGRGQFEGSGMGLAIVRKIVERHGGRVHAESQPGAGSVFIVELPVRNAGMSAPAVAVTDAT